ncbi:hypothetical protein M8C17_07010 [Micromonospora sp. RHAY321]|uniref:hypothetical protein n=1 Tax=Micromonospora sp. RHAY321 TaxID=2944807 RepID=UPI00207CBF44|nr:hypothetical protein [Micromonospora sp. RHAY321]MCO1594915.1 hypothetical protein [Micromonospora sp. RHAY321]
MSEDVREAAARNNADWCAVVCDTHGVTGRTDADAWSVPRRSPPWYPDAVTLRPGVDAGALLARIDAGSGASVKDSFADLDLSGHGFRVLFDAQWIHRPSADPPGGPPLDRVTTPERLAAWATAHGGGELFRPALLADPRVRVLARYDDRGAVVVRRGGQRRRSVRGVEPVRPHRRPRRHLARSARHPAPPATARLRIRPRPRPGPQRRLPPARTPPSLAPHLTPHPR